MTIRARNLLSRTMNLVNGTEERRLVESYKFNGWELDINSRSLISPAGEQYKLPRSEFRLYLTNLNCPINWGQFNIIQGFFVS